MVTNKNDIKMANNDEDELLVLNAQRQAIYTHNNMTEPNNTRLKSIKMTSFNTNDNINRSSDNSLISSDLLTLHAILWPSILFVVGFVCTFFSLIYVCRDWDMDFREMDFCIYITGVLNVI